MSTYATTVEQRRRLDLLRLLALEPGYRLNAPLLQACCCEAGLPSTLDQVEGSLAWLAETGLVNRETVGGVSGVTVATLTPRGLDVSRGLAEVPGVARPLPGE
ncbi:VpaChn25_0724 family phage protein [Megalodesulfovibrio paquesii]